MEDNMDSQEPKPKKTRIRKRSLAIQLEAALRDAARASDTNADRSTQSLIQARLQVLNHRLSREESGKLTKALAEVERLRKQNEKLKDDLATAVAPPKAPDIDARIKEMVRSLNVPRVVT
jgi:uncharacterized protein YdcH (DUF465 family)